MRSTFPPIGRAGWPGSIKGNVKRKHFSRDAGESSFSSLSPFVDDDLPLCASTDEPMEFSGTWCLRRTANANLKRQQAEFVVGVPTMVLSETSGQRPGLTAFLGCPRGHRVARETCGCLSRPRILALEPERFTGEATQAFTRNGCTGSALKLLVFSV